MFLERGGTDREMLDRVAREELTKKIHLNKDLKKEREQPRRYLEEECSMQQEQHVRKPWGGRIQKVPEEH